MTAPAELTLPPGWDGEEPVRVRWTADDGAVVEEGTPLCEIETAKAVADLLSPASGTLRWAVPDGPVEPGTLLGRVFRAGEHVPPAFVARRAGSAPGMTLRKRTEIGVLREGRDASLPSTVMAHVAVRELPDRLRDEGASLTAVVVHECARALRRHPGFNASFDGERTVTHERIRIGVALDVEPHGLKLAIVDDAETKTVDAIAADLQVLLYRYMTKALAPADLSGATFTVTDLTSFGATWSVPLLVGRQAAILALGLAPGPEGRALTLSLTFDHRVASGRDAALFLRDVARRIGERARGAPLACARCARAMADMNEGRRYLLAVVTDEGTTSVCPDCLGIGRA